MSSNITTPPRDGQRFSFKQQSEQINNTAFSMVVIPAATSLPPSKPSTSTATSPTTTSPPSTTSTSCSGSGGLSAGAKAGIGAGVAVVALIALLILNFCLVERRKRASQLPSTSDPKYEIYETEASQTKVPLGELDVPPAELNAGDKDHAAELLAWNSR
ncbi:uncharacterized protein RCO7_04956 [Rhynchosporium graminicola]|uniref:Uncharacterized protein n=1 Tax=Rhynchosporium graminicola TaxID=2792576 RepID=A0A1E1KE72_9HELO|nr:uncharacterized protein RCO7_04956 [Rhynchosporium commune]